MVKTAARRASRFQNPLDRRGFSRPLPLRSDAQLRHPLRVGAAGPEPARHALQAHIGGWQSNGILSIRSGFPFTVTQGSDLNTAAAPSAPTVSRDGELENPTRAHGSIRRRSSRVTCNISEPAGSLPLRQRRLQHLRTPGQKNLDFSHVQELHRSPRRFKLQFRSEFINAFNTPYFGDPNRIGFTSNDSIVPDGPRMGEIRTLRTPMRIIQFALKMYF